MQAYLITNTTNGKQYVGVGRDAENRWKRHQIVARKTPRHALHVAMAESGLQNFAFEIIASAVSWQERWTLEKILVDQYRTLLPDGYNMTKGGAGPRGYNHTAEAKSAISAALALRNPSAKTRAKYSRLHLGKVVSQETRAKQAAAKLGKKLSPEHSAKIGAALAGVPKSAAHKAAVVAANAASRLAKIKDIAR